MPELPEVETIRRGLQKTIVGKKIAEIEIRLPKIVSIGPKVVSNIRSANPSKSRQFRKLLAGQKILSVKRRAKMLLIDITGPLTILIHLKMTGQLVFAKKGEKKLIKILNLPNAGRELLPHKHTHVIFKFSDGSKLFYNDMRQFGYLRLVTDKELPHVKELSEYGPEPLIADLTANYLAVKAKSRPGLAVKLFLMDPKVVAGIGNIYSDEILYWSKIRPTRALRSLKVQDFQAITKSIPKVLKAALKAQGSSVGDYFKVDGTEGRYGRQHMVYGRYGEKCKKCRTVIKSVKLGGRTGSYCPKCQK